MIARAGTVEKANSTQKGPTQRILREINVSGSYAMCIKLCFTHSKVPYKAERKNYNYQDNKVRSSNPTSGYI